MTKSKNKHHLFTPAEIDAFDHMRTGLTAKGAAVRAKISPAKFIPLAQSTFPDRLELERIPSRENLLTFLADRSSKVTAVTTVCYRCRGPKTTRGSLCDLCSGKASLRERWEADHAFQT